MEQKLVGLSYNVIFRSFNARTNRTTKITKIHNTVVNTGLTWVRDLMKGDESDSLSYIAIGTGNTAPTIADTSLETEVLRALAVDSAPSVYVLRLAYTFTVGSGVSHSIVEAGVFNQLTPSGSVMFNRAISDIHTLDTDNPLEVIVEITVSRP